MSWTKWVIGSVAILGLDPSMRAQVPAQPPKIEVRRVETAGLQLRSVSEAGKPVRVETSDTLDHWTELKTFSSSTGTTDFELPFALGVPRWFVRAVMVGSGAGPAGPAGTMEFVSPEPGSVMTTNRPTLELRYSGFTVSPQDVRLRRYGTNVPSTVTVEAGRIRVTPNSGLPEGFVELWAGLGGTNAPTLVRVPRLPLNIRTTTDNLDPVAADDVAKVDADGMVAVSVLANDRDPNGDPLVVRSVETPVHGQAVVVGDTVEYRPAPGFRGRDSVRYSVADGRGGAHSAVIVFLVVPKPELLVRVVAGDALQPGSRASVGRAGPSAGPAPVLAVATVAEAVGELCNRLPPGKRGKIVIEKSGVLEVGALSFDCSVEIENRGGASWPSNTVFNIGAGGAMTLAGFGFGGGAVFNVGGDLDLVANTFGGPALVRLIGAPETSASGAGSIALRPAAVSVSVSAVPAGGAVHQVRAFGNENTSLVVAGDAAGDSTIDIERGRAVEITASGTWSGSARAKFEGMVSDSLSVRAELAGTASVETSASAVASATQHDLSVSGDNRATVEAVVSGSLEVKSKGLGSLKVRATANRGDAASYRYSNGSVIHEGSGSQHVDFDARVEALGGGRVSGSLSEDGLRVSNSTRLLSGENTTVDLTLSATRHGKDVGITGRGDLKYRFRNGVEVGASLETEVTAGTTQAELQDVKVGLGVRYEFAPGSSLGVRVERSLVNEAFTVHGPQDERFDGAVSDTTVQGGVKFAFDLLGAGTGSGSAPGRAGAGAGPRLRAGVGTRVVPIPPELVIRNTRISRSGGGGAGQEPVLVIRGCRARVTVESCTVNSDSVGGLQAALSIEETPAAVTLVGNTLRQGGIVVDGDTDAGPAQGLMAESYRLERNQITAPETLHGILVEDLKNVIVIGNSVEAVYALQVRSARVTLRDSAFPEFPETTALVEVGPGRNGPGLLEASGCDFRVPVHFQGGGYGRLSGNTFRDTELGVGFVGTGPAYVLAEGNTFTGTGVAIAPSLGGLGYLKMTGNTFRQSDIDDENLTTGGLVNDVVKANGGLDPAGDVLSPVDFDRNSCPDYPDDCFDPETGECGCSPVRSPPSEHAFPEF